MNCKNTLTFPDGSTFTSDPRTFGERVADHVAKVEAERDALRSALEETIRRVSAALPGTSPIFELDIARAALAKVQS